MPAYRLTLAVGVGREDQTVGLLRGVRNLLQSLRLVGIELPLHREAVVGIDRPILGRQIPDVAIGRQNLEIAAEILLDRFRLGRRFDNDQLHEKSVPREPLRIYAREWLRHCASVKGDLGAGRTSVNRRVPLLRKSQRGYLPTRMKIGRAQFLTPVT